MIMRIVSLISLICLIGKVSGAFVPSRSRAHGKSPIRQQISDSHCQDLPSQRLRQGLVLQEQVNDFNDNLDERIIDDPDAYLAEMELALEESRRRRAALEDELMNSMAESVINRTPQTALAELELAKANKESVTRDLIKATTGLLGPIGGIAGVSAAGVVAGRNVLQQRQAKIEEMERQAYQQRLEAALISERKVVQTTAQRAAAVTGIAALGFAVSNSLDKFSMPKFGGISTPTVSSKNEKQVTQTKLVDPKPELPYLEAKIKAAEQEVQAKEKAVLEATKKSQQLEQLLKTEEQSSKALQAQLRAAEEAAKTASAKVSAAELAAKEALARAAAVEKLAAEKPAPVVNTVPEKEENTLAALKSQEAESLDLKRKAAESMSGMRSPAKSSTGLMPKPITTTSSVVAAAPAAAVAATALENPLDIFSKVTNNPAVLSVIGGGIAAAAGVATAVGIMNNKDDDKDEEKADKKDDEGIRATMKIATGKPKTEAKKADELPFNIPPPPKEISSPSRVSKRGDDVSKPSFASSSSTLDSKTSPTAAAANNGVKGSVPAAPKFISSYDGREDGAGAPKSSSPPFGPGAATPKGSSAFAPKGSTGFQAGAGASKFGASSPKGASPFGPSTTAPKGSSPFQAGPAASKFPPSPKGTPSFDTSSDSSKREDLFFTGASTGSPFGPGAAPKGFGTGPGGPKGFQSSGNGKSSPSSGVKGAAPNSGAPKGFSTPNSVDGFGGVKGDVKDKASPMSANGNIDTAAPPSSKSPFGTSTSKNASPFGAAKGSPKGGASFFTGASTGSPFGPGTQAKGFGTGPGVPKGFPTGEVVNGNNSAKGAGPGPSAPKGFGSGPGAPKGFSSTTNLQTNAASTTKEPGTVASNKGFGTGPTAQSGFAAGQSTGDTAKGAGSGFGAPKGFPSPTNGQSSAPKGFPSGPGATAVQGFGGTAPGSPAIFPSKVSGSKGPGAGPGAPKGFANPTGAGAAKGFPSSANPFGGGVKGNGSSTTSPNAVASKDGASISDASDAEATKKPTWAAPVESASKSSFRPLSGGRSPAETNNSFTGARKRESNPFAAKKESASFDPFPDPKSVPNTPGGPTFPAKKDGTKTFTSFKNGSEVTSSTTPFGTGPRQSSSTGRSSFDGKKSFQPLPKTGLKSPFQSSVGATKKAFEPYSGPKGTVKGGDRQSFKPYSESTTSAGRTTSKADLPAEFKPTFPKTTIGESQEPFSKGTTTPSSTPSGPSQSTSATNDSAQGVSPAGGASVSASNADANEPMVGQFAASSTDSPASSTSYLSGMSGPTSKDLGVKSSYSPYGAEKKTEPSKDSSPFGQWTPGASNPEASANLGAPTVPASSEKTNDSYSPFGTQKKTEPSKSSSPFGQWTPGSSNSEASANLGAPKSQSGESSVPPTTTSETPKSDNTGSVWDSLSSAISNFSGKSDAANKPETGAVNTGEPKAQPRPDSYPLNNVQSSYAPFSPANSSVGNNGAASPTSPANAVSNGNVQPTTDAQSTTSRNSFGVGNAVEPARNIVEPFAPSAKPVDQGTAGSADGSSVKSSYAPFAKTTDRVTSETKTNYSPFGWTPGSSNIEASETSKSVPNPAQTAASQDATNGKRVPGSWSPDIPATTTSQGDTKSDNPSGKWSPEVPATTETTASDTGFSPFAQWLEQSAASASASPPTPTVDSTTRQVSSQDLNDDYMTATRQSRRRYFQPNNISAPRMDRNYASANQQYSNQAARDTYGVRDIRRPDGYASDRSARYMNRAQEQIVDPTRSYSRPVDPNTQGGGRVSRMSSAGTPSGNWFDAGPSQQRRTMQEAAQPPVDSFYSKPYGSSTQPGSNQDASTTDTGSQRGRASYYEGARNPSGNWFDDGRGGGRLLDQDWQWNRNN